MPHHFGLRSKTRNKFSKSFRTKGMPNLSRYLTTFKKGDYVDIIADSSIHKGMPYQFYHGRTGVVFNVTKSAVGVEVTKVHRGNQLRKRIHVRIEHVRKSRCNEAFIQRVQENDAAKQEAKKKGIKLVTKRVPVSPKEGKVVKVLDQNKIGVLEALPYTEHYL
jgi:large subunit ribosomal protein L21e